MKKWYVVQVVTGTEELVKTDLEAKIREEKLEDYFGRILIPEGGFISSITGQEGKEKFFPGYLLVEMELLPDARKLVTSTDRVSRFLGGIDPVALSSKEIEKIFEAVSGKPQQRVEDARFATGQEVKVKAGPFAGFVGLVEEVDLEHKKLRVGVSIFGRMTSIDLGFEQVEK